MDNPNYSQYSLEQLLHVRRKIDRVSFPDRAKEIDDRIAAYEELSTIERGRHVMNSAGTVERLAFAAGRRWSTLIGLLFLAVGCWQIIGLATFGGSRPVPMMFRYYFENQAHVFQSSSLIEKVAIGSTSVVACLFIVGGIGWVLRNQRMLSLSLIGLIITSLGISIGHFQFDVDFIFSLFFTFGWSSFGVRVDFVSLAILLLLAYNAFQPVISKNSVRLDNPA